ncbi:hypothetical protein PM3016_6894 [Paenibacillus mucilaginosus 3016]|uniref:Uncharacterized protein n=1 Tax=Paenibacillus mucilaginosus 3016 TaxID=1116391 RepID=H6NQM4_9BACL|nr:hypothetical protein PM3016_6894 [Paenibacillus mucilaginosus 3016]
MNKDPRCVWERKNDKNCFYLRVREIKSDTVTNS